MTTENARQTIPPTVTPSHWPYGVAGVASRIKHPRQAARCQARLLRRFAVLDSWGRVAREVEQDKGLVRRVALGLQVAPPAMRAKLYPETPRQRERPTLADVRAAYLDGALGERVTVRGMLVAVQSAHEAGSTTFDTLAFLLDQLDKASP